MFDSLLLQLCYWMTDECINGPPMTKSHAMFHAILLFHIFSILFFALFERTGWNSVWNVPCYQAWRCVACHSINIKCLWKRFWATEYFSSVMVYLCQWSNITLCFLLSFTLYMTFFVIQHSNVLEFFRALNCCCLLVVLELRLIDNVNEVLNWIGIHKFKLNGIRV